MIYAKTFVKKTNADLEYGQLQSTELGSSS